MIKDPPRQITVEFTPAAKAEWYAIPEPIRAILLNHIKENAPRAHEMMVVSRWTWECPDHIWRVFKCYTAKPGWRLIFRFEAWDHIIITRIAARCNDPYGDGR
jgi:hypothetical protein